MTKSKRTVWGIIIAIGCLIVCMMTTGILGTVYLLTRETPTPIPRAQTPLATAAAHPTKIFTPIPTDRAACEALGGRWARIGLAPRESCNLPTTDAGKSCNDSVQCQSFCLADLSRTEQERVVRTKTPIPASGKCAAWHIVVGCIAVVEDGMVKTILCID